MEPERRDGDKDADQPGDRAGKHERRGKGQAEPLHQDGMGVTPGGEKRGMAEAGLPGVTRQDHQAHSRDGPDQDVRRLSDQEIVQQKGQPYGERDERSVAQGVACVRKQADVLLVAGLEMHAHPLRPSWRGPGRECRGDV